jgi:hypothetical protein
MTRDGEAEPEAAELPREPAVSLPKSLEHVRQEFGLDTDTGIADHDLDLRVDPREADLHAAAAGRELHRVGQEVPHDLLQAIRISRHDGRARIEDRLQPDAFGVGRGPHGLGAVPQKDGQLQRLHVQTDLARDDARDVEHVFDDLRQLGNNHPDGSADRFVRRVAKQAFGSAIPRLNDAVQIFADDRVVGEFNDGREAQGRCFEIALQHQRNDSTAVGYGWALVSAREVPE